MSDAVRSRAGGMVRRGRAEVSDTIRGAALARVWDLLQLRNEDGDITGVVPYTDEAISLLESLQTRDPDSFVIAHHLAIARHARAWDWELAGDPRADREWQSALDCWRALSSSPEFWASLDHKYRECEPDDPAQSPIADLRRNLLENLLDIHVDFVRRYSETNAPDRANAHIEIIRRALLPPALQKKLIGKVFEAMTGTVPDAKASRNFNSALAAIERFLALYPDHLPALRMHCEIVHEWVEGMSYKDAWAEIESSDRRARICAERLARHPDVGGDPLCALALEELASTLASRGSDRGLSLLRGEEWESAREALEIGVWWGRLLVVRLGSMSPLRDALAACLYHQVICLHHVMDRAGGGSRGAETELAVAARRCQRIVGLLQAAVDAAPQNVELQNLLARQLDEVRGQLAEIETWQQLGGRF